MDMLPIEVLVVLERVSKFGVIGRRGPNLLGLFTSLSTMDS
jgi:hypothetical protein